MREASKNDPQHFFTQPNNLFHLFRFELFLIFKEKLLLNRKKFSKTESDNFIRNFDTITD